MKYHRLTACIAVLGIFCLNTVGCRQEYVVRNSSPSTELTETDRETAVQTDSAEQSVSSAAWKTAAGESVESTAEAERPSESEYVASSYESVSPYSWQDLYVIMLLAVQTSQMKEGRNPVFTLIPQENSEAPLLLTGMQEPDSDGYGEYYLYVYDQENLYQLLQLEGTLLWDQENGVFYWKETGEQYQYDPHALLKTKPAQEPQNLISFPYTILEESLHITSENIESYLMEVAR